MKEKTIDPQNPYAHETVEERMARINTYLEMRYGRTLKDHLDDMAFLVEQNKILTNMIEELELELKEQTIRNEMDEE